MTETLRVLVAVELLGLAALPLAQLALGRLALGGVAFAKPLGLLMVAWLVWMGTVAGISNSIWLVIGACGLLALAGLGAWPVVRRRPALSIGWRRLAAMEGLFVAAFLLCALFNAYAPDVWQTEKPMDMAFINATIASSGHPPHDPWMAGEDLNYYYLGHLAMGVLIRLTDVEPSIGYNLALAVVFALAVVAAFGLAAAAARELGRPGRLAGGAAVVLLVVAGTPGGGLDVLGHDGDLRSLRWFRATRVIDGTINEFPFFSFLLGDLHAHVIAGPITLVALAFCVQAALHGPPRRVAFWERTLTALTIGGLYAINSWSFPVAAGLLALALAIWARDPASAGRRRAALVHWTLVIGLSVVVVLAFLLEFEPNVRGIGLVQTREGLTTFLGHHAELYGTLAWALVALYAGRLRQAKDPVRTVVFAATAGVVALPLLAEVELAGAGALALLLAVALHALWSRRVALAERAVWLLVAGGLICLVLPEVVYVRDEFDGSDLFRMNTVFKMGYQAWYLLAVAGGCAVALAATRLPRLPLVAWGVGLAVLAGLGLMYTVGGSYARKEGFGATPSLNGRGWMAPGDVQAIDWLRANTSGDAVILEAVGEDFSAFGHARISTFTGRPAVLGWEGHEVQWHHRPAGRRAAVEAIYTSDSPLEVRRLLNRFGVEYVVIGELERIDYGDTDTLERLGRRVFRGDDVEIYAVGQPREPEPDRPTRRPPVLGGG